MSMHFATIWEPIGYGVCAVLSLTWTLYIDRGFPWWNPLALIWITLFWPMWLICRVGIILLERAENRRRERLYRDHPWLRDIRDK